MTVCIAATFQLTYPNKDAGRAVLAVSDRMLTAEDIEYEPSQLKIGLLTKTAIVMVAGEIYAHSEAIGLTRRHLMAAPEKNIAKIAEVYASYIRKFKTRHAAQLFLSPLGLDEQHS